MRAPMIVRLSLVAILLTAQGCAMGMSDETFLDELLAGLFNQAGLQPPAWSLDCGEGRPQSDGTIFPPVSGAPILYRILPGTCAGFVNPCLRPPPATDNGRWVETDTFAFDAGAPGWLSVRTTSVMNSAPTREICVAPGAPPLLNTRVPFTYAPLGTDGPSFGRGHLLITTVPELDVQASATPQSIPPGQSTQLNATVSGGQPPYRFAWFPFRGLSDAAVPNPVATVLTDTGYTVTVIDAVGQTAEGGTFVHVTAPPPSLNTADLAVTVTDGPDPVRLGGLVTYTIAVVNNGPATATSVVVTDTLPNLVEGGEATATQGTCTRQLSSDFSTLTFTCALGTLDNAATATVTVTGFTFQVGPLTNTVRVSAAQSDLSAANNTAIEVTTVIPR